MSQIALPATNPNKSFKRNTIRSFRRPSVKDHRIESEGVISSGVSKVPAVSQDVTEKNVVTGFLRICPEILSLKRKELLCSGGRQEERKKGTPRNEGITQDVYENKGPKKWEWEGSQDVVEYTELINCNPRCL